MKILGAPAFEAAADRRRKKCADCVCMTGDPPKESIRFHGRLQCDPEVEPRCSAATIRPNPRMSASEKRRDRLTLKMECQITESRTGHEAPGFDSIGSVGRHPVRPRGFPHFRHCNPSIQVPGLLIRETLLRHPSTRWHSDIRTASVLPANPAAPIATCHPVFPAV
jgi:hypothetical protein